MSYNIKCSMCGTKINSSIEMIGYEVKCQSCGGDITVPLTNFTAGMVSGNYWIQKSMGTGNISETFIAKRVSDNEKVYLKILSPCVTKVHENVEQFMIEMCRSHQIDHPNLISVYETGKMNGHYYLATRYVEGECLDKRIERTGPLSEKEALRLSLKIARILRSCWHDYGIVHRAIKPSNILIDDAGEIFLLDVGNCKQLLISEEVPLERLDNLGTLADFMSPEEAQGVFDVDCSSDIYSLGATLFYLLTGTKPYSGSDTTQVLLKHLNAPTPNVNQRSGDVSRETAKFIRAMMDKDPENRIYAWREVVSRLKQLLKTKTRGSQSDTTLKTHVSTSTEVDEEFSSGMFTPPEAPANSAAKVAIIAIVVILLLGVLGVVAIIVSRDNPDEPVSTTPTVPDTAVQSNTPPKPQPPKPSPLPEKSMFDRKLNSQIARYKSFPESKSDILKALKRLRRDASTPEELERLSNFEKKVMGVAVPGPDKPTPPTASASGELMKIDESSFKLDGKAIPQFNNTGFESGSLSPWKDTSLGKGNVQVTGGSTKQGRYALQMTPGGNATCTFKSKKGFDGKKLEFSAHGKIKNSQPGFIEVIFYGDGDKQLSIESKPVSTKDFTKYTIAKTIPKGCNKIVLRYRY